MMVIGSIFAVIVGFLLGLLARPLSRRLAKKLKAKWLKPSYLVIGFFLIIMIVYTIVILTNPYIVILINPYIDRFLSLGMASLFFSNILFSLFKQGKVIRRHLTGADAAKFINERLIPFRDLQTEVLIDNDIQRTIITIDQPLEVHDEHVIALIEAFRDKKINLTRMRNWCITVKSSSLFCFSPGSSARIQTILDDILKTHFFNYPDARMIDAWLCNMIWK